MLPYYMNIMVRILRSSIHNKLLYVLSNGVSKLKEVFVDILFAGLLLIPIALYFLSFLTEKFISTFQKSVAQSNSYLLSLSISV